MDNSYDDGRAAGSGHPHYQPDRQPAPGGPQPAQVGRGRNPGGLTGFFVSLPTTAWLIAANIAVYVVTVIQSGSLTDNYSDSDLFLGTALFGPSVESGQYWRLVTSSFDHFGPWHIFANMWMLLILGLGVERAVGSVRYLGLYAASVLGGAAAAVLMTPMSLVAGASGGVFGLMGAWAVIATVYRLQPQGLIALIALNLVISVVLPGISLAGHVGGLIGGAIAALALIVIPHRVVRRSSPRARETMAWLLWAVVVVVLFGAGVWAAGR